MVVVHRMRCVLLTRSAALARLLVLTSLVVKRLMLWMSVVTIVLITSRLLWLDLSLVLLVFGLIRLLTSRLVRAFALFGTRAIRIVLISSGVRLCIRLHRILLKLLCRLCTLLFERGRVRRLCARLVATRMNGW